MKTLTIQSTNPYRKKGSLKQKYFFDSGGRIFGTIYYGQARRTAAVVNPETGMRWSK